MKSCNQGQNNNCQHLNFSFYLWLSWNKIGLVFINDRFHKGFNFSILLLLSFLPEKAGKHVVQPWENHFHEHVLKHFVQEFNHLVQYWIVSLQIRRMFPLHDIDQTSLDTDLKSLPRHDPPDNVEHRNVERKLDQDILTRNGEFLAKITINDVINLFSNDGFHGLFTKTKLFQSGQRKSNKPNHIAALALDMIIQKYVDTF